MEIGRRNEILTCALVALVGFALGKILNAQRGGSDHDGRGGAAVSTESNAVINAVPSVSAATRIRQMVVDHKPPLKLWDELSALDLDDLPAVFDALATEGDYPAFLAARRWLELDGNGLMEHLNGASTRAQMVIAPALQLWSRSDPQAALDAALQMQHTVLKDYQLHSVVNDLILRDDKQLDAILDRLPRHLVHRRAVADMVRNARLDPIRALGELSPSPLNDFLVEVPIAVAIDRGQIAEAAEILAAPPWEMKELPEQLTKAWQREDPAGLDEWIRRHPPVVEPMAASEANARMVELLATKLEVPSQ